MAANKSREQMRLKLEICAACIKRQGADFDESQCGTTCQEALANLPRLSVEPAESAGLALPNRGN